MHKNIILAIGITILFLGVGIQPAIAKDVSLSKPSDNGDDCDICPSINKINNLVDKKEYKKLANMIDKYFEMYSNSKLDTPKGNFRPICGILRILHAQYIARVIILLTIWGLLYSLYHFFPHMIYAYYLFRINQASIILSVALDLNCDWVGVPPPKLNI